MPRFLGKHWILLSVGLLLLGLLLSVGLLVKLRSVAAVRQMVATLSNGQYALTANAIKVDPWNMVLEVAKLDIHPVKLGTAGNEFEFKADSLTLNLKDILRLLLIKRLNVEEFSLLRPELKLRIYEKDSSVKITPLPFHKQVEKVQNIFFEVLGSLKVKNCQIRQLSIAYYPNLGENSSRYFINNINLAIHDLHLLKKIDEWNNENAVSIRFELQRPAIEYPDSSIKVDLDKLYWDTKARQFELNGFGFHKSFSTVVDSTGFRLEGIHLDSLNWGRLLKEGVLELGVLKATKGYFSSNEFRIKKKADSLQTEKSINLLDIIGPIIVRNLAINEIEFNGKSHSKRGIESFSVIGNQFKVSDLVVNKNSPENVSVNELKLKIKAYIESDSSKNFISGFGEMSIRNKNLVLKNYFLRKRKKTIVEKNSIDVNELILINFSIPELLKGNLKADNLVINGANFNLELNEKKKNEHPPFHKIQSTLRRKLAIELITINEAAFNLYKIGKNKPFIKAASIHTSFSIRQLLRARSIGDILNGNDKLVVPQIQINLPEGWVECRNASFQNETLKAEYAKGQLNNGLIQFNIYRLEAGKINPALYSGKSTGDLMHSLQFEKGNILVREDNTSTPKQSLKMGGIQNFKAGNFNLDYSGKKFAISCFLDSINIKSLVADNDRWAWKDIYAKGKELKFTNNTTNLRSGKFYLSGSGVSLIQDNNLEIRKPALLVTAKIPVIEVSPEIKNSANLLSSIKNIKAKNSDITIILHSPDAPTTDNNETLKIELPAILLEDPKIRINKQEEGNQKELLNLAGGRIEATPIQLDNGVLSISYVKFDVQNFRTQLNRLAFTSQGLKCEISKFRWNPQNDFSATLQQASVKDGNIEKADSISSLKIQGLQATLQERTEVNIAKNSLNSYIHQFSAFNINAGKISYENKWNILESSNIQILPAKNQVVFDFISFRSKLPRDEFFATKKFQTDLIQFSAGQGSILNGFNTNLSSTDTSCQAKLLTLKNFHLDITRDKRYPRDSVTYRPLLADMLKKIPIKFSLDSISLTDSRIEYHEILEDNGNEINIWFAGINGSIHNIRNTRETAESQISIDAKASLMDKGSLSMFFVQPYLDKNQSFTLHARMGPLDLKTFSPILKSLYNAEIQNGSADSANINAIANEQYATGNMLLDYQKLKVGVMREDGSKKGFLSFIANTILKNDNEKTAIIFQPRLRDRSIFNYWAKIAMNGLLGNMGLRNNQKALRKYYQNNMQLNSSQ